MASLALPFRDEALASIDRAVGFDWVAVARSAWTTASRPLIDQLFRIRVTVIVEHDEIRGPCGLTCPQHPSVRQLHRLMTNFRRGPLPLRIAPAQVSHFQLALPLRSDLVEQLDLVRRRTVCQH